MDHHRDELARASEGVLREPLEEDKESFRAKAR
jgi:hypothetical protein